MNIFKLFIPKQNVQTVEELESYTVEWHIKAGWADQEKVYHKVFIHAHDAREFKKTVRRVCKIYWSLD